MHKRLLFLMAILAAGVLGCAATSNPLVGTWRLVTTAQVSPDSVAGPGAPLKILNESHFAFGFTMPNGEAYAGGGRYSYRKGIYTEIIEYHSDPFLVGRFLDFKCAVEGDTWHHAGTFDIEGRLYEVNEVWKRVEK